MNDDPAAPSSSAAARWRPTGIDDELLGDPRAAPAGDRAALPARAPWRGNHRVSPVRRPAADLGSGREPAPRAEGAARAAGRRRRLTSGGPLTPLTPRRPLVHARGVLHKVSVHCARGTTDSQRGHSRSRPLQGCGSGRLAQAFTTNQELAMPAPKRRRLPPKPAAKRYWRRPRSSSGGQGDRDQRPQGRRPHRHAGQVRRHQDRQRGQGRRDQDQARGSQGRGAAKSTRSAATGPRRAPARAPREPRPPSAGRQADAHDGQARRDPHEPGSTACRRWPSSWRRARSSPATS